MAPYVAVILVSTIPSGIVGLFILFATGVFIKAYIQNQLTAPRGFFYLTTLFLVVVIVLCICYVCFDVSFEVGQLESASHLELVTFVLYPVQAVLLLVLFSYRLIIIFQDSVFAVSKCEMRIFIGFWLTGAVMACFMAMSMVYNLTHVAIEMACYAIIIGMAIWLNLQFISKLLKVCQLTMDASKDHNSVDMHMLDVATNGALLSLISSLSTLLLILVWAADTWFYLSSPFRSLDLMSNALSALFSFKYFNPWYMRMCGCCHRQCQACLTRYARHHRGHTTELKELETPSPQSQSNNCTDRD